MDQPRTPDVPTPKSRGTGQLVNRMARLLAQAFADAIAPLDLAPAQFVVLRELWRSDGLTQSQLAKKLDVEQATIANTLKRMARDGLITRVPHPGDSRAQLVRLTERARLLEAPAKAAAKNVNARAFGGLSRKEQRRFVEMTHRVISALTSPCSDGISASSS